MGNVRRAWLWCLACGIAVLIVSQVMGHVFPTEGAGYSPGYGPPVLAFEFATTADDLAKVFGTEDDPARDARVTAMDHGNWWDYAFMLAYGLYLWTFFRAVRLTSGRRAWLLFGWFGILAAVCDGIENAILLGLTADLATAPHLDWLPYPVWTKFFLLMLTSLAAGYYLVTHRHWFWTTLGLLTICGSLTVLLARWSPADLAHLITPGITIAWVSQLAYAIYRSLQAERS
ncbi:MAG: hypothetical protein KDA93_08225 [Planctomycetaceae bacterium]|nr:hypothetical protein [Planctomycetaceae bacterium]